MLLIFLVYIVSVAYDQMFLMVSFFNFSKYFDVETYECVLSGKKYETKVFAKKYFTNKYNYRYVISFLFS